MKVWIGCLACYNAGDLVGHWYDCDGSATDVTPEEVHRLGGGPEVDEDGYLIEGADGDSPHEELWIFDTDETPHSSLAREMSPLEAAAIGDRINDLEHHNIDLDAYAAYGDLVGFDFEDDYLGEFEEAFQGTWDDRKDFAYELAEELGSVPKDYSWPASYIDWDAATRDLFMDYSDAPAEGGRIYVFRCI